MSRYVIRATFDEKENQIVLQCSLFDKERKVFIEDLHIGKENELWFYIRKGYYSHTYHSLIFNNVFYCNYSAVNNNLYIFYPQTFHPRFYLSDNVSI